MVKAADEVRRALVEAFPNEPLDPTDAFTEWGITYLDGESFIAGTKGQRWQSLLASFLEEHDDALYFLGPKAFAEVLPAYVQAMFDPATRDGVLPETLLTVLAPPRRRSRAALWEKQHAARMGALNAAQRDALVAALSVLQDTGDAEIAEGARRASQAIRDLDA